MKPDRTPSRGMWGMNALVLAAGLMLLSPVLYSIWMSFQTADGYYTGHLDFTRSNYELAVAEYNLARDLLNSLIVSGVVTLAGIAVATKVAYAFARDRFPGGNLAFAAVAAHQTARQMEAAQ